MLSSVCNVTRLTNRGRNSVTYRCELCLSGQGEEDEQKDKPYHDPTETMLQPNRVSGSVKFATPGSPNASRLC